MRVPIPRVEDPALVTRRVRLEARHVAYFRGLLEASEGLASMFAERGGELLVVAPASRARELDELLEDVRRELGAILDP
jgi:hypothetical protein